MSSAATATSSGLAAVGARLGSRVSVLRWLHSDVGRARARRVLVVVVGLVGAAGLATRADHGWLVVLGIGLGLGLALAVGRRDVASRREHARLEAELHVRIRELRESRARLAHVAHAERRGIERDLHDGCQQRLIALRIKLALAEERVAEENGSAVGLIQEISVDAESALEDLHALVHGIYPAVLLEHGLAPALKAIGRSSAMPVRVSAEGSSRRYPADVEVAAYFACAEALQNVAKHAGADATVRINLRHEGPGLAFEVSDDGRGFGDQINAGSGLANMEDRVNAVGGRLSITSARGCGTTVQGWIGETQPIHSD
jgi:signal transduction histidine kinase